MEDSRIELHITRSAAVAAHGILHEFRDQPIDEVGEQIERLLQDKCAEARRAGDVRQFRDTLEGDIREIYKLKVGDGRSVLGVVADDYVTVQRPGSPPGKVLITVVNEKQANKSILGGRWTRIDGTPILEPKEIVDVPVRAPKAPTSTPARTGAPKAGSSAERDEFVLALLRKNPNMVTMGPSGVHAAVRARFGVGMRDGKVQKLRARLRGNDQPIVVNSTSVVQRAEPTAPKGEAWLPKEIEALVGEQAVAIMALVSAKSRADQAGVKLREAIAQLSS